MTSPWVSKKGEIVGLFSARAVAFVILVVVLVIVVLGLDNNVEAGEEVEA